ncbi:hypothetical protein CMUS01_16816 [Colletotrichum musicola]|uniref:Uncharacterized protein n=1 Tax=Colletotrichum musicola TaxID=2175873 RepID=A0A8H6IJN7_9PEZI|nr:hypothetical protein CMUS01_16816 [Colletotrichum musicola]
MAPRRPRASSRLPSDQRSSPSPVSQ